MSNNSSSSGIGFTGLLTIVFIILKLLGKINWSWFWVLSPIWISIIIVIILLIAYFILKQL
jgi:energy-coupling factor transporter transmembrane protein EcfT